MSTSSKLMISDNFTMNLWLGIYFSYHTFNGREQLGDEVGISGIFVLLRSEEKNYSAKSLPPMGIEPATRGLWHILCLHSHAFSCATLASVNGGTVNFAIDFWI